MKWFGLGTLSLVLFIFGAWILGSPGNSDYIHFNDDEIALCEATASISQIPDVKQQNCEWITTDNINPHHRQFWLIGKLPDPRTEIPSDIPIGLIVSAKAASQVYLNGIKVGENGIPGIDKTAEKVGQLDSVFYISRELVKNGNNSVAILMSGQHSVFESSQPILALRFGQYHSTPHYGASRYWFSLLTFGVFLIGSVYYGATLLLNHRSARSTTIGLACILAALQLISEVTRSVWAYPYPFHDARLILICSFSMGVGLVIALHTFKRFNLTQKPMAFGITVATTVVGFFFVPTFDGKATWAIWVPIIASAITALSAWSKNNFASKSYCCALFIFAGIILINPSQYLDTNYYVALMVLLAYFFIQEAYDFQSVTLSEEKANAVRLQLEAALDRASSSNSDYLLVTGAGSQEKIDLHTIVALSRDGEYVSMRIKGERKVLHRGSLGGLQKALPPCFLSVHRSHIINTNFVVRLKRLDNGAGELTLIEEIKIPVSRRVMPKVRKALSR